MIVKPDSLVQMPRIAFMGNGVVEGLVVVDGVFVDVDDILGAVIDR